MAFGNATFTDAAGAASDLFQGQATKASAYATATGLNLKAYGDRAEAGNYDLASTLAKQNETFTEQSTAIQQMQQERKLTLSLGSTRADVAGSGFAEGGSALDILRDSAAQGALTKAVMGQQGLITEAGYQEQATSYTNMSAAARYAAGVEDQMADAARAQGDKAERNSYITAGIKGAAAVATLFV